MEIKISAKAGAGRLSVGSITNIRFKQIAFG